MDLDDLVWYEMMMCVGLGWFVYNEWRGGWGDVRTVSRFTPTTSFSLSLSLDFWLPPIVGYKLRILSSSKFASVFIVGKTRAPIWWVFYIHPSIHTSLPWHSLDLVYDWEPPSLSHKLKGPTFPKVGSI